MRLTSRLLLGLACSVLCLTTFGCGNDSNDNWSPTRDGQNFYVNNFSQEDSAVVFLSNASNMENDYDDYFITTNKQPSVYTERDTNSNAKVDLDTDKIGPHDLTHILMRDVKDRLEKKAVNAKVDANYKITPNTKYTDMAKGEEIEINVVTSLNKFTKKKVRKIVDNDETTSILVFAEVDDEGYASMSNSRAKEIDRAFGVNNPYSADGSSIYDTVRNTFGKELTPGLDGEKKIIIVALYNDTISGKNTGNKVYGYFYAVDEFSAKDEPYSNEGEILYMNAEEDDYNFYSTMAHEFQHMCCFNQKYIRYGSYDGSMEDTCINEGMSQLSEDINGFGMYPNPNTSEINNYLISTSTSYLKSPEAYSFNDESFSNRQGDYGQSYLLARYVADRFGIDAITELCTSKKVSKLNFTDTLRIDFKELFHDFGVTNCVDHYNNVENKYNYTSISLFDLPYTAQGLVGGQYHHAYAQYPYKGLSNNYRLMCWTNSYYRYVFDNDLDQLHVTISKSNNASDSMNNILILNRNAGIVGENSILRQIVNSSN
ncbi:hypothetical protein IJT10_01255 [bacterium]|nr:hypothetical protein [bacterium]